MDEPDGPHLARDLPDLKVAIIGHTGRGNYGHWLDEAFDGVVGTQVVAADVNRDGVPDVLTASKLGAFVFITTRK